MNIWRLSGQVIELANTVFWGLSEGFGLYTPPPTASSMYQNALSELNQAKDAGVSVVDACTDYAEHFTNQDEMYTACENQYQAEEALRLAQQALLQAQENVQRVGEPIIPSDITAEYGNLILLGLGFATAGALYLYCRSTQTSDPVAVIPKVAACYADLAPYCKLAGPDAGKKTAFADFTKHFRNIMKKYKGIDGPLSDNDRTALEGTLKALVKYYFWKDHSCETDGNMRAKLFQKLSLAFHSDKFNHEKNPENAALIQKSDVTRYCALLGEDKSNTLFNIIVSINKNYPDKILGLADALTAHDARELDTAKTSKSTIH